MSMLSDQQLDLDNMSTGTEKVSELIFVLRSAFQPKDFKMVEEILVARENRLRDDIQHWKREYELMERKEGEEKVTRLLVEDEIGKCKRELDELDEKVTQLEEDKKLLKEDNRVEREKAAVFEEREKQARAKYEKLSEEKERLEREKREMVVNMSELDSEKAKAERKLESFKKKNEENEVRVAWLEKEIKVMLGMPKVQLKIEEEKSSTDALNAKSGDSNGVEVKEVIFDGEEKSDSFAGAESGDTNVNRLKRAGEDFGLHPCSEGQIMLEKGGSSHRDKRQKTDTVDGKNKGGIVIDISDSDDELPAQIQTPNVLKVEQPKGRNPCTSSSQRQRGLFLDIGRRENGRNSNDFAVSSSSSESDDSDTICGLIRQIKDSS